MTPETLYYLIHLPVAPAWALLVLAPGSVWTRRLVHSALIGLGLALVYLWLLILVVSAPSVEGAGLLSLSAMMALFDAPMGALAGWAHYLVFDLFVGAWIARDALRRGLGRWRVAPCLLLTLMFGPLGLASYLLLRGLTGRGWSLDEAPPR